MGQVITRRGFVSGVVGGALILGFDPLRRSWVTKADASTGGCAELPPLDGELRTVGLEPYAADFGRIISRQPWAVLIPGSVNDIVKIMRFARAHDLKVAANGQAGTDDMRESHSNFGQSQVQAGIVIDMKPLNTVFAIQADHADVAAGVHWSTVLDAALAIGKTPPVLNDYMHLSVGGTLSVGGIGGTSLHFGAQIDNVLSLEVVTGRGDRVRCSRTENRDLFEAVLGGGGQCGIIVRAKLRLLPARTQAKVYTLMYDDINLYVADQRMLLREGALQLPAGAGGPQRHRHRLAVHDRGRRVLHATGATQRHRAAGGVARDRADDLGAQLPGLAVSPGSHGRVSQVDRRLAAAAPLGDAVPPGVAGGRVHDERAVDADARRHRAGASAVLPVRHRSNDSTAVPACPPRAKPSTSACCVPGRRRRRR